MNVLSLLGFALGFIFFAGGAVAYFAKGRGDSIITYQEKEIKIRDDTIKRLEQDNAALTGENKTLREQNEVLHGLAQGSPQLVKLTLQIKRLTSAIIKRNA